MLKNYLLVMLRSLYREKVYALINVLGLSLALACCLILTLYIRSELTYDQHNVDHERIARITNEFTTNGESNNFAVTSTALGPLVLREYPQIGQYVRFQLFARGVFRSQDTELYWDDVYLADDNVFEVFTHEAVYGDLEEALVDPSSIAISESFARQYFGDRNPIGENISTDTFQYKVTAVFKDLPDNSHLKYSALLSRNRLAALGQSDDNASPQQLHGINIYTYFKVPEGFDLGSLPVLLNDYYDKAAAEYGRQFNTVVRYQAQPLAEVHFNSSLEADLPTGNIFYIYGFAAVAIFVLLVACINYTNLAIARATKRAKEVGMRKVIGAEKGQLIAQFMGESLAYTLVALVLGVVLVEAAETFTGLNGLLGKNDLLNLSGEPALLGWLLLAAIVIGCCAGAYPALYLSSISPLAALTATKKSRISKFSVGQLLVFVQFFVSVAVVACTILMALQMAYVASKPLGYERENRLSVTLRGVDTLERISVIRNELLSDPNVLGVAESSFVPAERIPINGMQIENNEGQMESTSLWNMAVSKEFLDVMAMELVAGRDFSQRLLTDVGRSVIVNERLVRKMGWDEPLGKRIQVGPETARVVGVVRDFHFASLHQPVEPMIMAMFQPNDFSNVPPMQRNLVSRSMVISVDGDNVYQALNHIEAVLTEFDPQHPFEFRFFDDALNEMYASEANLMKLTGIFAGICIFIACMGLFGLSAFTTEQRTKEIGVRKVLGASTTQIVLMLARSQMLLVAVAAIFASAVSYVVISDWLTAFSYRTDIAWWAFVVATLSVAGVAFATVALQSSRTAQSNPVNALRYE